MAMTENGISTTTAPGSENYEIFHAGRKLVRNIRCMYDYRHTDGTLFSCVARNLDEAREKRDEWLEQKSTTDLQ